MTITQELVERVERAAGPDEQELIHEAFRQIFPRAKFTRVPGFEHIGDGIGPYTAEHRVWQERDARMTKLLCAGAFLDAAMILVPEGWAFRLDGWLAFTARVFMPEKRYVSSHSKTSASLALLAASLRARMVQS